MKKKLIGLTVLLTVCCILLSACLPVGALPAARTAANIETAPAVSVLAETMTAAAQAPRVLSMNAVPDASEVASEVKDPFANINKYLAAIYKPDRKLYLRLYKAVDNMQKSVDVSDIKLSVKKKYSTAACLYSEAGYRFYYLRSLEVSQNGKKVTFRYNTSKKSAVQANKKEFGARLAQLLHNVSFADYTPLQKFFAYYGYVCENSDYSHDLMDSTTISPYSILMKGEGICTGFANLTQYTLSRLGIPVEYVGADTHVWNIVKLGGKWYQTDVTWGAGSYGNDYNYISTLLMDDKTRLTTLKDNGLSTKDIRVGYPGSKYKKPPACTDTRFAAYNRIYGTFAMDAEAGKIYFIGDKGMECMNLDCTGRKTVMDGVYPNLYVCFGGALYYTDTGEGTFGHLYKYVPGGTPELLDGSGVISYLKLEGAELVYGTDAKDKKLKRISLLPCPKTVKNATMFAASSIPRSRSFKIDIKFSAPMKASQDWNHLIYLADRSGKTLPLHFTLSKDGKTLSVRSKTCVYNCGKLSLYTLGGIAGINGGKTAACVGRQWTLK